MMSECIEINFTRSSGTPTLGEYRDHSLINAVQTSKLRFCLSEPPAPDGYSQAGIHGLRFNGHCDRRGEMRTHRCIQSNGVWSLASPRKSPDVLRRLQTSQFSLVSDVKDDECQGENPASIVLQLASLVLGHHLVKSHATFQTLLERSVLS